MKTCTTILTVFFMLFISRAAFSQGDDSNEVNVSNKQWHLKRDQYAVSAITLLSRLETLNAEIDSLKQLNDSSAATIAGCEEALYALVGATRQEVADFRIIFDRTEKYLTRKSFAPSDVEKTSYSEITNSKIRCLPEFAERYEALKTMIDNFSVAPVKEIPENKYVVAEGDNLWSIAAKKYGNPYMWRLIWQANKLEMKNEGVFSEKYYDEIMKPNLIFPGQVLIIPPLSNSDKNK